MANDATMFSSFLIIPIQDEELEEAQIVTTPLWDKCEDETCTYKSGNLQSSGTPKTSEVDCKGQNTSY